MCSIYDFLVTLLGDDRMSDFNHAFQRIYNMSINEINQKFTFLGEGISRSVFAVNNKYVIKVAKGREGLYQNKIEKYVYIHAGKRLRKYLCPILWWRPGMLVMPKAIQLSSLISEEFVDLKKIRKEANSYKEINELAEKFYLLYEDIEAVSSWGIINDIPVLIDYGCTTQIGDKFYS